MNSKQCVELKYYRKTNVSMYPKLGVKMQGKNSLKGQKKGSSILFVFFFCFVLFAFFFYFHALMQEDLLKNIFKTKFSLIN